ncbi:MAG: ribonuclease P protein component [Candidatus Hydrogenedentes bacterium]|nr:ribonuclease P protein component [Candidatus Hydrogenedentota bacterium]
MAGPNRFPGRERLTRKRDFEAVFEHGRKRVGREFICFAVRREGQGRRFGFAVSRKVGKAVVRNRVKRYLREIYRANRACLSEDIDLVFVARPQAAELNYHQCAAAIRRLLNDGGLLGG